MASGDIGRRCLSVAAFSTSLGPVRGAPVGSWTAGSSGGGCAPAACGGCGCRSAAAAACGARAADLTAAGCFLLSYAPHGARHPLASDVASFAPDARGARAAYNYSDAHVDKANVPSYDVSAVLYFNTAGVGFDGGSFAFIDDDDDRLVEPKAGRLLVFSSGCDNLHRVLPVTRGSRFAMTMWWTWP